MLICAGDPAGHERACRDSGIVGQWEGKLPVELPSLCPVPSHRTIQPVLWPGTGKRPVLPSTTSQVVCTVTEYSADRHPRDYFRRGGLARWESVE